MSKEKKTTKKATGRSTHPNPDGSTRNFLKVPLKDYLGVVQTNVFEPLKTGVFVRGFDPSEFERAATVLNPETGLCFTPRPDIRILTPDLGSKVESSPVFSPKNMELAIIGASERDRYA